jgi:hypothetical protein
MVTATTNKNYVTDAQVTLLGNTSNTNSGDETQSTIKTKLGVASSGVDGYLAGSDWSTFNGKQASLGFTPENVANKATLWGTPDNTQYPTTLLVKTDLDLKAPKASPVFTGTVTMNGGTNTVGILAPAGAFTNYSLTLPTTIGAVNQVLANDAVTPGTLVWKDLVYAYCYDNVGGTLPANTDIALNSNGEMSNITHTAGTTGITVPSAGVYKIDYGINVDNNIGASLVISINNVVEESSRIYFVSAIQNYASSVILSLAANDVIRLRNASAVVINRPAVGVNTHIVITKIN